MKLFLLSFALAGCAGSKYTCEAGNVDCTGGGTAESSFDDEGSNGGSTGGSTGGSSGSSTIVPEEGYWQVDGGVFVEDGCGVEQFFNAPEATTELVLTEGGFVIDADDDENQAICELNGASFVCPNQGDEFELTEDTSIRIVRSLTGEFLSATDAVIFLGYGYECDGEASVCSEYSLSFGVQDIPCLSILEGTLTFLPGHTEETDDDWDEDSE